MLAFKAHFVIHFLILFMNKHISITIVQHAVSINQLLAFLESFWKYVLMFCISNIAFHIFSRFKQQISILSYIFIVMYNIMSCYNVFISHLNKRNISAFILIR